MGKDWNQRLTETITVVRTTAAPGFNGSNHDVATALDGWNRSAPADRRKRLSELMSQDGAPNRPSREGDRALRRAAILLQCVLVAPDPAGWAQRRDDVNKTGNPLEWYTQSMISAHDSLCSGALAGPNLAFLLASPQEFLEKYKISVSGKKDSGRLDYGFTMKKGAYRLEAGNPFGDATKISAVNIPAVLFETVKDSLDSLTGTRSSDYNDCAIMLTTQFTGCTYCFMVSPDRTDLVAAHLDPGGGNRGPTTHTGESISQALRQRGGFRNGNGGAFRAYGRVANAGTFGYPYAKQVIITALKNPQDNGRWAIYAQIESLAGGFRVERIDNDNRPH